MTSKKHVEYGPQERHDHHCEGPKQFIDGFQRLALPNIDQYTDGNKEPKDTKECAQDSKHDLVLKGVGIYTIQLDRG